MKITSIQNVGFVNKLKNTLQSNPVHSTNYDSGLADDVFVKSNQNISFKGDNNGGLPPWLLAAAAVGGLGILTSIMGAKLPSNEDYVFTPDGNLIGRISVWQKEEAIAKAVKNADIDLSKERFTFADPINGRYINESKGIDIDLLKDKYIDPEKGIFIDKANEVSAVYKDGAFEPVVMNSLTFKGSSMSNWSSAPMYTPYTHIDRDDFIQEHNGMTPEEFYKGNEIALRNDHVIIHPEERRNFVERFLDFIFPKFDTKFDHDAWGREVVSVTDAIGKAHKVPLNDQLSDIIHKHDMTYEEVQKFITYSAEHPIVEYISKADKAIMEQYQLNHTSMQEFLEKAAASEGVDKPLEQKTGSTETNETGDTTGEEVDADDGTSDDGGLGSDADADVDVTGLM